MLPPKSIPWMGDVHDLRPILADSVATSIYNQLEAFPASYYQAGGIPAILSVNQDSLQADFNRLGRYAKGLPAKEESLVGE